MKRVYIGIIIVVVILGIIFVPKYLNEGDKEVKFKVLKSDEVPQKLKDILPNYLSEERALSCKIEDDVFVVVTRGEKNMEGYSVAIDKIEKGKKED
ncbi:protease complex subunit PrcB family protein, partial [Anaerosalibacter bizertensis]|nr:protease complex subunit PrcB family protein [Anaerosalibacter bizertensis]